MCIVCDEFGGMGCPACQTRDDYNDDYVEPIISCHSCGEELPSDKYNIDGRPYCVECFDYINGSYIDYYN
ncbi:hypothetical protein AGMMS49525_10380 [Bacteroidia bacterium]|nr:hypothetical protein AGMMS49525_10380 [Bacteroidia bacterium]